jgi:hypothetical protein
VEVQTPILKEETQVVRLIRNNNNLKIENKPNMGITLQDFEN